MPSLMGVELARVGTWNLARGGRRTFTLEDFTDAVDASRDPEFGTPGVYPGHTDPRFDGEPALGRVENMRVVGDRLVGDLVDLPGWLTARVQTAYPRRSIEGYTAVPASSSGRTYRLVVEGVALLGVSAPAMQGLAELPAAVAAVAQRIAASSSEMNLSDEPVAAGAATSATREAPRSIVYASRTESREGVALDPAELRRNLGLAEDATDADVTARIAELAARPEASTTDTPPAEPVPVQPGTPAAPAPAPTPPAPAPVQAPTSAVPDGAVLVSQAVLEQLQADAALGVAAARRQARDDEDRFIARHRSRLGPASNPRAGRLEASLRREYQRNPGEAEALAASHAVIAPTIAAGHDGGADTDGDSTDALYAELFGAETKGA